MWNLFKGWNGTFRVDDPKDIAVELHSKDYSERTRPQGFNPQLWHWIKTLYGNIQDLKSIHETDVKMEEELFNTLSELTKGWTDPRTQSSIIHAVNPDEWGELIERRDGHALYRVRS